MARGMDLEDLYLEREYDRRAEIQPLMVMVDISKWDRDRLVALAKSLGRQPEPNEDLKVLARYAASHLLQRAIIDLREKME